MTRKEFLQHYWRYYLVLEEKFKNTLNYIELDWQNAGTFSNEYALLLQSIGAELDNFFKVYCGFAAEDRKNMNDYCTFVLSDYSDIVNQKNSDSRARYGISAISGLECGKSSTVTYIWEWIL